jgi:hypothetical protein
MIGVKSVLDKAVEEFKEAEVAAAAAAAAKAAALAVSSHSAPVSQKTKQPNSQSLDLPPRVGSSSSLSVSQKCRGPPALNTLRLKVRLRCRSVSQVSTAKDRKK